MKTVFQQNFTPILYLSKFVGLIKFSYMIGPFATLIYNPNSKLYVFLEFTRTFVLLLCTYIVEKENLVWKHYMLMKFWIPYLTACICEVCLIKLINGLSEFDQKLILLPPSLSINYRLSNKKYYWNIIIILTFIYILIFNVYVKYFLWTPKSITAAYFIIRMFGLPFIVDFVIVITSCFYLNTLYNRFKLLNDLWLSIPYGFIAVYNEMTHYQTVMLIEDIRLLHSDLSELSKFFNMCYGPLLLGFFVFGYINIIYSYLFILNFHDLSLSRLTMTMNIIRSSIPYILMFQCIILMMAVIIAASRVSYQRKKIISYLRLMRISNIHIDLKKQVKMFMKQISDFEADDISAFGFFKINYTLIISFLVLLFSGLATILQMKDHPIVLQHINTSRTIAKQTMNNIT